SQGLHSAHPPLPWRWQTYRQTPRPIGGWIAASGTLGNSSVASRCVYFPPVLAALITALIYAVVQQHWKPPPPTPDESLPSTRMRYSPGSEKVAVVLTISFSMAGVLSANLISP